MLSEKAIASFQQIYEQQFNKKISRDEAIAMANKLLRLFEIIYRPVTKKMLENLKKYET